jgi:hypothetical protein
MAGGGTPELAAATVNYYRCALGAEVARRAGEPYDPYWLPDDHVNYPLTKVLANLDAEQLEHAETFDDRELVAWLNFCRDDLAAL